MGAFFFAIDYTLPMSLLKRVAHNTAIQLAGKIISTILGVAVVAMVTRALGPAGYGEYTTVITYLSFFGIVADLGLTLITAQMISERGANESRIVSAIFSFRIVSALILFGVAPVVAFFSPLTGLEKIGIAVTTWSFFFVSLQQTLVGIFQKHLQMRYPAVAEICGRVALFVVTWFAVDAGKNLIWFLIAVTAGNIVNFLYTFFSARKFVAIKFVWDMPVMKELCVRAAPIAVSIIFNLIYLKADTLILRFLRPLEEVGLYGAAYRVIDILMMVPVMLMGVILPIATAAWSERDSARTHSILQKTFDAFVVFALPVWCGGILLAPQLMRFVAGEEFVAAAGSLRILMCAFIAATMSTLFGHFIVALQKQRSVVWVYATDAALALAAYLIFIPRFGSVAAGWATVGSEVYAAIILCVVVLRTVRRAINFHILWRVCVAAGVMSAALWFFGAAFSLFVLIAVGTIIFGIVSWALNVHKVFVH